jgi:hypothetical protein
MEQFADLEQSSLPRNKKNEFVLIFTVLKTLIFGPIVFALSLAVILTCMITDLVSFLLSALVKSAKRIAGYNVLKE